MPKVSICVPAYGNPEGIRRLLDSVAAQSYQDYEVVLTDDSADESVRRAVQEAGLCRLRYQKNEIRLGASGNWNEAVRLAEGDYIKMMHHDDWFTDGDSLGRFVRMLDENPEATLAFSGTWQVTLPERDLAAQEPEEGAAAGKGAQRAGLGDPKAAKDSIRPQRFARGISPEQESLIRQDWRNLFLGNYIGAPSATIYRRNPQAYETRLTWVMDMEYYMRLLAKQPRFACTIDPLVCIGVSGGQLTEQCREDGELNMFEYGFLFEEFGLGTKEAYRRKLIDVALSYDQPYGALERYGISKEEYQRALRAKKKEDFKFLLGVAKQKLLGR